MKTFEINVNHNGVNAIKQFAKNPSILSGDDIFRLETLQQLYLPGVTIPGIKGLDRTAFNIPIVGDDYPAAVTVEHPSSSRTNLKRRIRFIFSHPDDQAIIGRPTYKGYGISFDAFDEYEDEKRNERLDTLFDEHFGDDGFVHVVLEERYAKKKPESDKLSLVTTVALAEIVTFPEEAEFTVLAEMKDKEFGAFEILAAMKAQFGK